MKPGSFVREMKERKLVQWAFGYLAGAWVLIEFSDFLAGTFDWHIAVLRVLTVILGFAFLAVLVVAWYHGEQGHQRMTSTELLILTTLIVAAALVSWRVALPAVDTGAAAQTLGAGRGESDLAPLLTRAPEDGRKSIAVLPFANMSAEPQNEYFSDGVTEDIIARLSQIDGLRVISRTSVMQYKNTDKNIPRIGRELGVDYVLEGSVRRTENEVRIVAQLIDARTDEHVWSETYNRGLRDILAVQSDVAEHIGVALKTELSPGVLADLREQQKVDPVAYQYYLQGLQTSRNPEPTAQTKAAELFEAAISRDSTLVIAWSALAETMAPPHVDFVERPAGPENPELEVTLRKAMESHARAPGVQTLVFRRAFKEWDFEKAEAAAKRAIAEHPNNAHGHRGYGAILARSGRYEEALKQTQMALSLDPMSAEVNVELGELLYAMGRFDEAIAQLRKAVEMDPRSGIAHMNLGLAYHAKGMRQEAVTELRQAVALSNQNPNVRGYLGYVLASTGDTAEAARILTELQAHDRRHQSASAIAQVLTGLGETEKALDWLQKAVDERTAVLLSPRVNRSMEALQSHPRFAEIMRFTRSPVRRSGASPGPTLAGDSATPQRGRGSPR